MTADERRPIAAHEQRHLEELLDREIEAARRLSALLAEERETLVGPSSDAVEAQAARKTALIKSLEALEAERRGLSTSDIASLGAGVAQRWRSLLDVVAGCRRANEVNGQIINIRQHQVRQLLDIIRGGSSVTYDPYGKTSAKSLRALAKA